MTKEKEGFLLDVKVLLLEKTTLLLGQLVELKKIELLLNIQELGLPERIYWKDKISNLINEDKL